MCGLPSSTDPAGTHRRRVRGAPAIGGAASCGVVLAARCEREQARLASTLAAADARPAVWVTLSPKVIGSGFKFFDYWSSVGFQPDEIPRLSGSDPLERIIDDVLRSYVPH